ncbi:MAG: GerMN domain-containing protein [Maledivibacter sp.]|jgi:spore germination protein GerM|nr:GerMN domain-containing protein [Maledivibacter sp.]
MLKTFFNLFLIVIICFSASIMPLNTSLFNLPNNLFKSITLSKPSNEVETLSSSYETNIAKTSLHDPTNIEFIMIGQLDKGAFVLGDNHDMILEVFSNNNLVKKYINTEFVTGLGSLDNDGLKIKYSFDISQENLGLDSGSYSFRIYSTGEMFSDVDPYEIFVTYLSNSKYVSSKNVVEEGNMYLTLYYPDKNYDYLVPVSRKIPYTNKTIRTSIDNLLLGPDPSLGLCSDAPIPHVPRIRVKNKTAYLYLPKDIGKFDKDSPLSKFALNSFVNTLTGIDGVDAVKFLKGSRETNTFFNGTNTKEAFKKIDSPRIFLGLETDTDKFLLTPIKLEEKNMDIDNLVPIVFNSLKTCTVNATHHNKLLGTIPENVELLNYKYNNEELTLNFNSNFLLAYSKRMDIQSMMVDSIIYSFTSIPEISKVSILVDGDIVDSINGIDISHPLVAPQFINVEN